jgi:hypothetical protein
MVFIAEIFVNITLNWNWQKNHLDLCSEFLELFALRLGGQFLRFFQYSATADFKMEDALQEAYTRL